MGKARPRRAWAGNATTRPTHESEWGRFAEAGGIGLVRCAADCRDGFAFSRVKTLAEVCGLGEERLGTEGKAKQRHVSPPPA